MLISDGEWINYAISILEDTIKARKRATDIDVMGTFQNHCLNEKKRN